jgi:hypothetical protein
VTGSLLLVALVAAAAQTATVPAAAPPSGATAKPVPALVKEVLADKAYSFCHDPHYPLTDEEAKLCPFVVSTNAACPAFADACKSGAGATRLKPPRKIHLDLPDLGSIPRMLLLVLLGLAIGGVLYLVLRNVRPWVRRPEEEVEAAEPVAVAAVETPQAVETDVERLLASARAAAATGDFGRAIMQLHAALLRRLEGAGLVAVHPSRTNGDYVRAVASARPALVSPVRSFVIDVERAQYGATGATAELFQSLLSRLALVTLDKLVVLALAAALVLGGGACSPDRGGWEYSPSGRAGVMELLKRAGRDVHERLAPVSKLKAGDTDALVLLPGAELDDHDWHALERWISAGGRLLLAGLPDKRPDWIGGEPSTLDGLSGHVIATRALRHESLDLPLPPAPPLRFGSDYKPLLVRGKSGPVYATERSYREGKIVVLADDRLLTNGALPFGDNARVLVLLLADTPRVQLVGELTGFVSPNPVASVTRGRLAPFLVQLMALAAIFYLFRGVAFGRLREPPPVQRRSFVEHVEALGQQYARARAARHVLASYGQWVIERLRERVALPAGSGLIALADAVAVRTGKPAGEVMRLLMEARETAAAGEVDGSAHLAAVRELGALLTWQSKKERQ